MRLKYFPSALICFLITFSGFSQDKKKEKRFKIHTVAFYNLENLFDTINDTTKFDEKSPIMEIKADREAIYVKKVRNMAPAIIGVCEVENRDVLVDVVNDPLLLAKDYGIIHYESPDARGIDVALLYQKSLFRPISHGSYEVKIYDNKTRKRKQTRDQLLVSGKLDGDLIHIIVNHWPSRSGGEARSRANRVTAAKVSRYLKDSLMVKDPYAKVFIMGDLNDDPTNESVKVVLNAKSDKEDVDLKGLYNPYDDMFTKNGYGTTAYRDAWSLFDQIMFTRELIKKEDYSSFRFYKAGIYNKQYLTNKRGRYKGYPFRSFSNGFTGGFSDHFPVYVYLIKEVKG
jgi:endonuclease/exonuclease/phosphatase family metal-dependent hydrolase